MAWQYHDYMTLTDAGARVARLRLHVAEVTAECGPDIAVGGASRSNVELIRYRNRIADELTALERAVGTSRAGFLRGRPI